jgi:hypothetical protein
LIDRHHVHSSHHALSHALQAALVQVKKANGELIAAAEAKSMFLATTSHGARSSWFSC